MVSTTRQKGNDMSLNVFAIKKEEAGAIAIAAGACQRVAIAYDINAT
jgi:hypothetical protein